MINCLGRSFDRPPFVVSCSCLTASLFYIKRSFSFYIFGIRLLLNLSPSEWFSSYKKRQLLKQLSEISVVQVFWTLLRPVHPTRSRVVFCMSLPALSGRKKNLRQSSHRKPSVKKYLPEETNYRWEIPIYRLWGVSCVDGILHVRVPAGHTPLMGRFRRSRSYPSVNWREDQLRLDPQRAAQTKRF